MDARRDSPGIMEAYFLYAERYAAASNEADASIYRNKGLFDDNGSDRKKRSARSSDGVRVVRRGAPRWSRCRERPVIVEKKKNGMPGRRRIPF